MLHRLQEYGAQIRKEKCSFMQESVVYLGFRVSSQCLSSTQGKTEAIAKAPVPGDVQQLRSFLGLLNYYGCSIPNLSTLLQRLNALLKEKSKWEWRPSMMWLSKPQRSLMSSEVLAHYDVSMLIRLACDASPYGLGAVNSHLFPDKSERFPLRLGL